jgi:drug/metabolite transporter (DMT)-like permease
MRYTPSMVPLGARYMALSALAFSVMTLLVKLVGQRLPSQEIITVRAALTLGMTYVALRRGGVSVLGTRQPLLWLRGAFGFISLSNIYYAVTHLPLAEATVIQYLHPPLTALLAALVLGERIARATIASIAISFLGLVVIVRPALLFGEQAQIFEPWAVAAAVAGAVFSACAYVTVRKLGAREHPLVIVFYFPLVALPASIPTIWGNAVWPTAAEWVLLVLVGIATQVGQVAVTRGLQIDSAGRAASYSYLQVLFAAIWGALLFDELPGPATALGAGLILLGALLSVRASRAVEVESSGGS